MNHFVTSKCMFHSVGVEWYMRTKLKTPLNDITGLPFTYLGTTGKAASTYEYHNCLR